ncbi:sugar efflux transporter, partial [Pseudomonas amygdali pv. mori str. 301020]
SNLEVANVGIVGGLLALGGLGLCCFTTHYFGKIPPAAEVQAESK